MNHFKETQQGGIIGISLFILIALVIIGYVFKDDVEGLSDRWFYLFVLSLLFVFAMFSDFKTVIVDNKILLKYGIGLLKKEIDVSRISSVKVVRNKWYYGWGIRYYGRGWMWNYKGFEAVELQFKDRKSNFRIGSGKAEELKECLNTLLSEG